MAKTDLIKLNGEKSGIVQLSDKIFGVKVNTGLVEQAVRIQLSNARAGTAHTKIRSEVRGGGRKPWKQKGTGNARAGSSRSPLWIGGGVTFGPRKDQNWQKKLPKKMLKCAITSALSDKLNNKNLIVVDKLELSRVSTKSANDLLQKMPIKEGTILIVIAKSDMNLELSFRNIPYVKVLVAGSINVYDILKFNSVIMDQDTIKQIEKVYLKNEESKEDSNDSDSKKEAKEIPVKTEKVAKEAKSETPSKDQK